jgi:hypothetical protein
LRSAAQASFKAKQWSFSSEKSELFADEPGPPVRWKDRPEI